MTTPIKIDVWSDIACPWCYIGKRNLEAGAAAYAMTDGSVPVEVEYHSYQLSPDTPVEFVGDTVEYLVQHKGLPADQVRVMLERVTQKAKDAGLDYDFDALQHTNTLKAHELLHYAKEHGKQLETKERLLRAYFVEGRHIGRVEDLADLAVDVGLDRDDVVRSLEAGEHRQGVQDDIQQAVDYGIRGVPFFVVDGRHGVSGAQPPEAFAQALAQVISERRGVA